MSKNQPIIAIIGGTGNLGAALARNWVRAGYEIIIGSRDRKKAEASSLEIGLESSGIITGANNAEAAERADIVVLTVPFTYQMETLAEIKDAVSGKIVVDTTVPLVPPKVARVQLPQEGSAALITQQFLGEDVSVVSAFHNVSAHKLGTGSLSGDVLVFGDKRASRQHVVELANSIGLRGIHGGALANSAAAEAMTSVLIFINRLYGEEGAGIMITGNVDQPNNG